LGDLDFEVEEVGGVEGLLLDVAEDGEEVVERVPPTRL